MKSKEIIFRKMGTDVIVNNENTCHRFRTEFKNKCGTEIFIEFGITQVSKYFSPNVIKTVGIGNFVLRIDHLFRMKYQDTNHDPKYRMQEKKNHKYEGLQTCLDIINTECNCNFNKLTFSN